MALVTWTPVECYSMTSKFANYHWTEGLFHFVQQSNDPIKGSLFCVAVGVAAVAETILNSVVLVLDTAKGIYTFPKKFIVTAHNAYVEKNEVELQRIHACGRSFGLKCLVIEILIIAGFAFLNRKKT